MGFALPAHLPLERYIGSCLISPCPPQQFPPPPLQPRKFQRQFYSSKTVLRSVDNSVFRIHNGKPNGSSSERHCYPNRSIGAYKANQRHGLFKEPSLPADEAVWTIGVPLLAVQPFVKSKNNRLKKNRKYDTLPDSDGSEIRMLHNRSQFSKLVVHTQGVPLIQSSRYEQSCKSRNGKAGNSSCGREYRNIQIPETSSNKIASAQNRKEPASPATKAGESSSVNSDENLSCNSLENSLPRIIKPRKRRKKDRKPSIGVSSSEQRTPDDNNNTSREDAYGKDHGTCSSQAGSEKKKPSVDLVGEPSGINENTCSTAKARFHPPEDQCVLDQAALENLEETAVCHENESAEIPISCQCRYCDPSSVIWNINTRGYSPSLVSCILPFQEIGPDHQNRSSGPVSGRGSGPVTRDSHAKFPPFNGAPRDSKTPPFPLKNLPNDCRFPPPNFQRPLTAEAYPFPFSHRGSPPFHLNLPNTPHMAVNSPPDGFSDCNGFAELYTGDRLNKVNSFLDKNKAASPESFMARHFSKDLAHSDFTQRFGLLNVSNFHMPTGFIDTSRPPPPIPAKIEDSPPRIPNFSALMSSSGNQRRSWEGHDTNRNAATFLACPRSERHPEPQLHQNSEFQSLKESKPPSPWPVLSEDHRVISTARDHSPQRSSEKVAVDGNPPRTLRSAPERSQNLEVSSEIVTSPNGHRDIEIKFFMTSSSPSTPLTQPFMTFPSFAKVPDFSPTLKTGT